MSLAHFIAKYKIAAEVIHTEQSVETVEQAAKALGVSEKQIVKSIVFSDREGNLILTLLPGAKRASSRQVARVLKKKHVTLADPKNVKRLLGYQVGGVPAFGFRKQPTTLIDVAVMKEEVVYPGGGSFNHLLKIKPEDLRKATRGQVAEIGFYPAKDGGSS